MYVSEFSLWVTNAYDRYLEAQKISESSKNDPPTEPYRSKYKAKEIFAGIKLELENKWKSMETIQVKLIGLLLRYEIGVINLETEEYSVGCDILTDIWEENMDEDEVSPEYAYLAVNVLNNLSVLWGGRGELQKALKLLKSAENIFHSYKSKNSKAPFDSKVIFTMDTCSREDWSLFDKSLTHTYYYMAQVYEVLDENSMSAEYCLKTLKRQFDSGDFETNDWATNCATLSQFYVNKKHFIEARHLLACSAMALFKYEIKIERDIEENKDLWMDIHKYKASLSTYWVQFSWNLLANTNFAKTEQHSSEHFFRLMEEDEVLKIENKIPCPVKNYDEAKTVFIFAQNHVSVAKSYYTLNDYANTYAQIVKDHSKLFESLASLDEDLGRRCKMHKRRIDMLEELLNKLNPEFYLSVCRQLQFEIGEIFYEMSDLKMKQMKSGQNADSKAVQKINSLMLKSVQSFQSFIDTIKNKDGQLPNEYADELVRSALIAHFYIAKNYSNITEQDSNKKRSNLMKAKECYSYIVDYVELVPHHSCHVERELPLIKQMLEFMPERIKLLV